MTKRRRNVFTGKNLAGKTLTQNIVGPNSKNGKNRPLEI